MFGYLPDNTWLNVDLDTPSRRAHAAPFNSDSVNLTEVAWKSIDISVPFYYLFKKLNV